MISYDRLGTNGRFGNQLFQYASLRGIAAHHGYEWCIPPDSHQTFANYGMHHCFKREFPTGFVNKDVSPNAMISFEHLKHFNPGTKNVTESRFNFDEDMFNDKSLNQFIAITYFKFVSEITFKASRILFSVGNGLVELCFTSLFVDPIQFQFLFLVEIIHKADFDFVTIRFKP